MRRYEDEADYARERLSRLPSITKPLFTKNEDDLERQVLESKEPDNHDHLEWEEEE